MTGSLLSQEGKRLTNQGSTLAGSQWTGCPDLQDDGQGKQGFYQAGCLTNWTGVHREKNRSRKDLFLFVGALTEAHFIQELFNTGGP